MTNTEYHRWLTISGPTVSLVSMMHSSAIGYSNVEKFCGEGHKINNSSFNGKQFE